MGFFIAMFFCNLLMPLIMLGGGYLMYKHPPKEINGAFGYRTRMSRLSKETWSFAHDFCGKIWIKVGAIILPISIIVQLPFIHSSDNVIGNMTLILEAVQIIILVASVFPTEAALKKNFDDHGNKR